MGLVVALLLLVVSVAAVADGDESNPPSAGLSQVKAIESEAIEAMSVLGGARTANDGLPTEVASRMDAHAPFGMNPDLSRLAVGNLTNSVYVIPANGHVCASLTVGEGANLICPATEDLADGRVAPATVTIATGGIAIYGIVPDGVGSVSVHTASASFEVETERNAYYTVVPAGTALRTARYDGPSGPVEFAIHDPSAVFEEE